MGTEMGDRLILQHEKFSGQRWDFGSKRSTVDFVAIGSIFTDCSFANFTDQSISFGSGTERSRYHSCEFKNVNFPKILGGDFEMIGCSFVRCTFDEFFSDSADIIDCTFEGKIKKGFISARPIRGDRSRINQIRGNDFSRADLLDFDFRGGVDLADQILPVGPDYATFLNAAESIMALRDEVLGWTDLERRKRLLPRLQGWKMDINAGQRDFFVSMRKRSTLRREPIEDLVGLLRGMQQSGS